MKLTLHGQVRRGGGGDAQTVTGTAGVFPSILRLHSVDDEGSVDKDANAELQITAGRQIICLRNFIKCLIIQRRIGAYASFQNRVFA